ncbi:hypothetical protein OOU_Y34scaffold00546g11 [Pyricularia oryzae Y34]|uniref:Thioesterase domain-containing protein n=2 Tax=Pyricularia oryzae TaxID=318829 RepID=A0AA97NY21_PYRO3|nr:hypothetical protein OOU_Y34scaffold00546g11 [Pyricularia oryzae Y34]
MAAKQLRPVDFVNAVLRSFMKESGLEPRLLGASSKDHTNRMKAIHGGTLASMVDLGGSLAVASMGLYSTGVSTDLNVTYLSSGGVAGDKLTGTATCDKIGKTLAYTTVTFNNAKGELAARGSHTKFVAKAWPTKQGLFELPEGVSEPSGDNK